MAGLRIMSCNLLVDRADPDDLRRVVEDVRPDVLAVQELGPRLAEAIPTMFDHGHLDPQEHRFGLGVVARLPVGITRLDLDTRPGWAARLEPDAWDGIDRPVEVLSVHIVNPLDRPIRTTHRVRRNQIAAIAEHVAATDAATVVIGDMNTTPRWPEYPLLTDIGEDAARSTDTARATWSHFTWGPRWIRIDHAFVAGARSLATRTVRVRGTDHAALVVDVEV